MQSNKTLFYAQIQAFSEVLRSHCQSRSAVNHWTQQYFKQKIKNKNKKYTYMRFLLLSKTQ